MSDFENPNPSRAERGLGLELDALGLHSQTHYPDLTASTAWDLSAAESPEQALELAERLRQRNRQLIERVAELEQALQRAQPLAGSPGVANSHELVAASQQVSALFQELEASHQVAQRQQVLIETLSHQLDAAQAQIAQLERECALAKQHYADQVELAAAAAENSQELRDRLSRQKQQVLQFRASLDRYLHVPSEPPALDAAAPSPRQPLPPTPPRISADLTAPTPLRPPARPRAPGRPIQPWSANLSSEAVNAPSPPQWIHRWLNPASEPAPTPTPTPSFAPEDDEAIPPEVFSQALREELNRPLYAVPGETVAEALAAFEHTEQEDDLTLTGPLPTTSPPLGDRPLKKRTSLAAVQLPQFPRVRSSSR